jgi:hypothetical protein
MRSLSAAATRDKLTAINGTGKYLLRRIQHCLEAALRTLANIGETRLFNVHLPLNFIELSQNFGRQGLFKKSFVKARWTIIRVNALEFKYKLFGLSTDTEIAITKYLVLFSTYVCRQVLQNR